MGRFNAFASSIEVIDDDESSSSSCSLSSEASVSLASGNGTNPFTGAASSSSRDRAGNAFGASKAGIKFQSEEYYSSDDEDDMFDQANMDSTEEENDFLDNKDFGNDRAVSCFRFFVLLLFLGGMIGAGVASWKFLTNEEYQDFEDEFDSISHSFADEINKNVQRSCLIESRNFAITITALSARSSSSSKEEEEEEESSSSWPFFTDDNFHIIASNYRNTSSSNYMSIAPIVTSPQRDEWKNYTHANYQGWIQTGLEWYSTHEGVKYSESENGIVDGDIFTIERGERVVVPSSATGPFAPLWQMSRVPQDPAYIVNFDALSNPTISNIFEMVQTFHEPVLSNRMGINDLFFYDNIMEQESTSNKKMDASIPTSLLVYPLEKSFDYETSTTTTTTTSTANIAGIMLAFFEWETFFKIHTHDTTYPTIVAVVKDSSCGEEEYTMHLNGKDATFVSHGDKHDTEFDAHEVHFAFAPFLRTYHENSNNANENGNGNCQYTISLYPSQEFYETYTTNKPAYISAILVSVVFFGAIIFGLYDCAVHSRQQRILAIAAQSERILSVLYPKTIRDRLFGGGVDHTNTSRATSTNLDDTGGKKPVVATSAAPEQSKEKKKNKFKSHVRYQMQTIIKELDASYRGGGGGNNNNNRGNNNDFDTSTRSHRDDFDTSTRSHRNDFDVSTRSHRNDFDASTRSKGTVQVVPYDASEPIADLFPNATVLFADIAGFTAWSSVREPKHVFTLLESVYATFDVTAKRRRVFKVETVGDCYVAVTGLPEARKDHATLMCRFARDCVEQFNELAGELETALGPDTADLAIRVGIHSGAVTAGVLRGEKSRFQLFGDTVNTAARIESGGKPSKVHLSSETAELLKQAGKPHWIRRRKQLIEAKGKGKLQTYWLILRGEEIPDHPDADVGSASSETEAITSSLESEDIEQQRPVSVPKEIAQQNLNLEATSAAEIQATLPTKVSRLVKWNVEVLSRLLIKVVAKRTAVGRSHNCDKILAEEEAELRQKYFVLDEVVESIPLPAYDRRIQERQEVLVGTIELPAVVMEQLNLYISCIAAYHKTGNPFHNFEHASHVMMSVSKLLARIVSTDDILDENTSPVFSVHHHAYGITSDPMTHFAVVLAALIHDVDHGGVSNVQLIKENHELATLFKGKSVAEQNSIVLAWDTLMEPRFHDLRRCIYADPHELRRFRQLLTNTVLATDIFDQELAALRKNRWETAFNLRTVDRSSMKEDNNRKATIVIEHLIQASDVAHTMQHWHVYRKWNERLFQEMTNAYRAGRMEKNPADFWYKGELAFFDNYVIPLAKKLKDCGVFGVSSEEYLKYALDNRRHWENRGDMILSEFIQKHQPENEKKGDNESTPEAAL